jgi:hypothetical protein
VKTTGEVAEIYAPIIQNSDQAVSGHRFRYKVNGRVYIGDRTQFGSSISYSSVEGRYVHGSLSLEPGSVVEVFYDPSRPDQAVLKRGPAPVAGIVAGLGLLFTLLGFGMI